MLMASAMMPVFVRREQLGERRDLASVAIDARNLTPNPFPRGKGNRIVENPEREGEPEWMRTESKVVRCAQLCD
jgi:hypothetical protein